MSRALQRFDSATWDQLETGELWYPRMFAYCRRIGAKFGVTRHRAAGALAVMSANVECKQNMLDLERALRYKNELLDMLPFGTVITAYPQNVDKALRIIHEGRFDLIRGPKVHSFYRAITGHEDAVTIDRWMARALGWVRGYSPTDSRYERLAEAVRQAARMRGVTPRMMQATVWIVERGEAW